MKASLTLLIAVVIALVSACKTYAPISKLGVDIPSSDMSKDWTAIVVYPPIKKVFVVVKFDVVVVETSKLGKTTRVIESIKLNSTPEVIETLLPNYSKPISIWNRMLKVSEFDVKFRPGLPNVLSSINSSAESNEKYVVDTYVKPGLEFLSSASTSILGVLPMVKTLDDDETNKLFLKKVESLEKKVGNVPIQKRIDIKVSVVKDVLIPANPGDTVKMDFNYRELLGINSTGHNDHDLGALRVVLKPQLAKNELPYPKVKDVFLPGIPMVFPSFYELKVIDRQSKDLGFLESERVVVDKTVSIPQLGIISLLPLKERLSRKSSISVIYDSEMAIESFKIKYDGKDESTKEVAESIAQKSAKLLEEIRDRGANQLEREIKLLELQQNYRELQKKEE